MGRFRDWYRFMWAKMRTPGTIVSDGLPYIGRFSRYDNLCAATGHSMMGLSLGPITGQLVSELLSGAKPSLDISGFRFSRFAEGAIGRPRNVL